MKTTTELIKEQMHNVAQKEYERQLQTLKNEVNITLKQNPHNTFKGTADEYINKYHLDTTLKNKIFKFYMI